MDLGALEVILMRSYSPQIGKESQEEMDNRVLTRLGFWFNIDYLLWANIKHNWSSFRANVSCSKIYSLCIKGMAQITAKNPSHRPPRAGFWPQPTNGYRFLIGGQTPFKFENMWLKKPSFRQSIQFWWTEALTNGWGEQRITQKLWIIKSQLKDWNKNVVGSIQQQKKSFLRQIADLDIDESDHGLTEEEITPRHKAKGELQEKVFKKEISWRQNQD